MSGKFVTEPSLSETPINPNQLSGFGNEVVRLTNDATGEVFAYVGIQEGQEKVYFTKAVTPTILEAVNVLLRKRKFQKHIYKERFKKAQSFADRKLMTG